MYAPYSLRGLLILSLGWVIAASGCAEGAKGLPPAELVQEPGPIIPGYTNDASVPQTPGWDAGGGGGNAGGGGGNAGGGGGNAGGDGSAGGGDGNGDGDGWTPDPGPMLPPGAECSQEIPCTNPAQTCCDGLCVDVKKDRAHCGGCGQRCEAWEDCVEGACSLYICEQVPEPPQPVDVPDAGADASATDASAEPFTGCPAGELCHDGTTCRCGAALTCGQSGRCEGGVCKCAGGEACRSGESCCEQGCKNLTNDVTSCGACGQACEAPADACVNGKCVCASTGTEPCQGACRDFKTDPQHCGACGKACAAGETCCNGTCVNTRTNLNHCGACGNACDRNAANQCVNGMCMCGNEPACSGGLITGRCRYGVVQGWGCGIQY
jgi:hypothetical protein